MTPGLLQSGQGASTPDAVKPAVMGNAGQATLTMFRNKDFYVNFLGNDRVYDKMNPDEDAPATTSTRQRRGHRRGTGTGSEQRR